jgi:uncharacterized tellurite resistance protein B-like protein
MKDFTEQQKMALLDLAMLAMYADGRLTSAEDQRIVRLLTSLGFATDYDREKQYDASVTRVSRHSQSAGEARAHTSLLARNFTSAEQRRQVIDFLDELAASDQQVAPQEQSYLSIVRGAFQS